MKKQEYDVICIGGGGAGVTAAVTAASLGSRVALVSKDPVGYGNTRISGGRMLLPCAAPGDSPKEFYQDILESGAFLNRRDLADAFANDGPMAVPISESFGHLFTRDKDGRVDGALEKARGSRFPRSMNHPLGGVSMGHSLRAALARSKVDVFEETFVTRVLVKDYRVEGMVCLKLTDGEPLLLTAKAVIIATGGLGWLYYPHTHNMRSATGDGYGLALNAGAHLIDMEQVQFRAFSITHPKGLAGIGCNPIVGRLLNNKGETVLDLATSDNLNLGQIAAVIALEIEKGGGSQFGGLTCDFSQYYGEDGSKVLPEHLRGRPQDLVKKAYGDKAARGEEPWDIANTEMYHLGGVKIDEFCSSSVGGLFAAGEASGGVHGGSRLQDSALAEMYVFGRRAGSSAAEAAGKRETGFAADDEARDEVDRIEGLFGAAGRERPVKLIRRLQRVMWEKVGPVRTGEKLQDALRQIREIRDAASSLSVSGIRKYNLEAIDALELPLMLDAAETVAMSAMYRKESRGSHIRLDFLSRDDENWLRNIVVWKDGEGMRIATEPVENKAAGGPTSGDR